MYKITVKEVRNEIRLNEDEYQVEIVLGLESDNELIPGFSKVLIVKHHNDQNGYEVDAQREAEIAEFLNQINK